VWALREPLDVCYGHPAAVAGSLRAFRDLCSARRIKVVRLFLRHCCGSSRGPTGHRRLPGRHTCHLSGSRQVGNYSLFWLSVAATLQSEPAERISRIERPRYSGRGRHDGVPLLGTEATVHESDDAWQCATRPLIRKSRRRRSRLATYIRFALRSWGVGSVEPHPAQNRLRGDSLQVHLGAASMTSAG
jgi:hypothetical protein